jgi:hypothetical protein
MNKVLKVILIILGVIVALFVLLIVINSLLKVFVYQEAKSFVPAGNAGICAENVCKIAGADKSFYNESNSLCICYKQNQVIKQTIIS